MAKKSKPGGRSASSGSKARGTAPLAIALIHGPVRNKAGQVVTTSITTFDLHDIARSAITFGVWRYYVVNPFESQRGFAQRIVGAWQSETGRLRNWTREEAFQLIHIKSSMEDVAADLKNNFSEAPLVVGTSAQTKGTISYEALRKKLAKSSRPVLILFGTGWGLVPEVLDACDELLPAIEGETGYNHLSVRSAVAIILSNLRGRKVR